MHRAVTRVYQVACKKDIQTNLYDFSTPVHEFNSITCCRIDCKSGMTKESRVKQNGTCLDRKKKNGYEVEHLHIFSGINTGDCSYFIYFFGIRLFLN